MSIRICIVGNSGSGKSTLAKALGKELQIPVFHLDRELLYGNFQKYPLEKRIELQERILEGDSWILDGNYDKLLSFRVKRSTLAIFLNTSRLITLPRVVARSRRGGQSADTVPQGANYKGLSFEFLRWVVGYDRKARSSHLKVLCDQYHVPFLLLPRMSVAKSIQEVKKVLNV